jgi:hypothetical protein
VIYGNGTAGKRCADNRDDKWACPGKYQTTECVVGYTCDPTSYKCVPGQPGEGEPKASCDAHCKKPADTYKCNPLTTPPKCEVTKPGEINQGSMEACSAHCRLQYKCDQSTFQCVEAAMGFPGGQPLQACQESCKKPAAIYKCNPNGGGVSGNFTCEECPSGTAGCGSKDDCAQKCAAKKPDPVTPNVLKNPKFWRGNQINKGYVQGEWDFDFDETSVTVTYGSGANKKSYKAGVQSIETDGAIEVWFTFQDGSMKDKVMKGRLQLGPDSAETLGATLAFGKAGNSTPSPNTTTMKQSPPVLLLTRTVGRHRIGSDLAGHHRCCNGRRRSERVRGMGLRPGWSSRLQIRPAGERSSQCVRCV